MMAPGSLQLSLKNILHHVSKGTIGLIGKIKTGRIGYP
jgi:hypothetical protein